MLNHERFAGPRGSGGRERFVGRLKRGAEPPNRVPPKVEFIRLTTGDTAVNKEGPPSNEVFFSAAI